MGEEGYVKLHRKLFRNDLWLSESFTRAQAWIDLFANANYKEKTFFIRGNPIKIRRGQLGWSEYTMAKRWRWSRNRVRAYLKWLVLESQIELQKSNKTTIITIVNYGLYQEKGTADKSADDTAEGTAEGTQLMNVKKVKKLAAGVSFKEIKILTDEFNCTTGQVKGIISDMTARGSPIKNPLLYLRKVLSEEFGKREEELIL